MKQKLTVIALIILCFALLLAGCGKSAAEKAAEALIKNATGTDVKIDGDKVEIKGEDGEAITVGDDIAWPKDKMGDLPELPGTINAFLENDDIGGMLTCIDTTKEEAEDYIQSLKDLGYTEDAYEATGEDGMQYYGHNGNYSVGFYFYPEGGDGPGKTSCSLTYEKKN